ncbi:uncharacterized protein [Patagioenas fasciata]|uniref:uncharacterized protein n=1 Tax=Patagioenas fasciata TaxID=372321 RepID=UPI003A99BD6D
MMQTGTGFQQCIWNNLVTKVFMKNKDLSFWSFQVLQAEVDVAQLLQAPQWDEKESPGGTASLPGLSRDHECVESSLQIRMYNAMAFVVSQVSLVAISRAMKKSTHFPHPIDLLTQDSCKVGANQLNQHFHWLSSSCQSLCWASKQWKKTERSCPKKEGQVWSHKVLTCLAQERKKDRESKESDDTYSCHLSIPPVPSQQRWQIQHRKNAWGLPRCPVRSCWAHAAGSQKKRSRESLLKSARSSLTRKRGTAMRCCVLYPKLNSWDLPQEMCLWSHGFIPRRKICRWVEQP